MLYTCWTGPGLTLDFCADWSHVGQAKVSPTSVCICIINQILEEALSNKFCVMSVHLFLTSEAFIITVILFCKLRIVFVEQKPLWYIAGFTWNFEHIFQGHFQDNLWVFPGLFTIAKNEWQWRCHQIQLGVWGCFESPSGPRQSPVGCTPGSSWNP